MPFNPKKAETIHVVASGAAEVRRRLSHALRSSSTLNIFEVDGYLELRRLLGKVKPSILLLDVSLDGLGGIGNLPLLQRVSPTTKIILLTANADHKEGLLAIEAGAQGYCYLDITSRLFKKVIDIVENGGKKIMILEQDGKPPARAEMGVDHLTLREREIAHLIANGASNKEIARRLEITEATVKAHLTTIFRKLGVADRLGLALLVREELQLERRAVHA